MADDLKIQLECRQDLDYLRSELKKYLDEHSYTTTPEQRQRQNVQVDGNDYGDVSPFASQSEQVDVNLEARLESLQVETDKLLVKISELRRSCPEAIRDKFAVTVEQLEKAMPGISAYLPQLPINPSINENDVDALVGELERLEKLNKEIPQLVSKLQRAKVVIGDAPELASVKGSASQMCLPTDALYQQRRIARQHDLAAKLLSQK